ALWTAQLIDWAWARVNPREPHFRIGSPARCALLPDTGERRPDVSRGAKGCNSYSCAQCRPCEDTTLCRSAARALLSPRRTRSSAAARRGDGAFEWHIRDDECRGSTGPGVTSVGLGAGSMPAHGDIPPSTRAGGKRIYPATPVTEPDPRVVAKGSEVYVRGRVFDLITYDGARAAGPEWAKGP